jgi:hypothetical protein
MSRPVLIGVALLLAFQIVAIAVAADRVPRKNKPLGISIKMMDGGLLGIDKVEEAITAKPSGPPPPKFYYVHYFWDGTHLRVRPGNDDKSQWSKEEIAKDGWYVTADYSTKTPRVILTKKPTKYSQWQFIATSTPRSMLYFIKNENDQGKDAWLDMEDTGKRYSWGQPDSGYRDVRVYKAILSFRNKRAMPVIDIEEDGGK